MVLHERDSGLGALDHVLHLPSGGFGHEGFRIHVQRSVAAFLYYVRDAGGHLDLLPDHDVVAEPDRHPDHQAENQLCQELGLRMETLLIVFEHLDVVVRETQGAAP